MTCWAASLPAGGHGGDDRFERLAKLGRLVEQQAFDGPRHRHQAVAEIGLQSRGSSSKGRCGVER